MTDKNFEAKVWPPDSEQEKQKMVNGDKSFEKIKVEKALFGVDNHYETESFFGALPAVVRTKVGYRTGKGKKQAVNCVEIEFDPKNANYKEILRAFWCTKSSSKKSAIIFYYNTKQHKIGQNSIYEHFLGKENLKKFGGDPKDKRVTNFFHLPSEKYSELERDDQKFNLQKHKNVFAICGLEKTENLIRSHYAARLNGYLNGYGKIEDFNKEITRGKLKLTKTLEQAVRMKMSKPVNNPEIKFMQKAIDKERGKKKAHTDKEDKKHAKNMNDMDSYLTKRETFMKGREEVLAERHL